MRTASITIDGRDYLLCFSARAVRACTERYGGVEYIDTALSGKGAGEALDEAVWLLATLMDCGARYARLNGKDNPPALSAEDLYDVLGAEDFAVLKDKIVETILSGRTPTVEAEPPKNAKTTPAAQ